ncbi:hypothetical protein B0O99DRAFT_44095 [Bisporella sp. PMI_857]|nr:hypothetical protein B0O99DRAFT_44095 [Bisporella sp. PMI_857]
MNLPIMDDEFLAGKLIIAVGSSESGVLPMGGQDNHPLVSPNTTSSTVPPQLYETVHMGDIQPSTAMTSRETPHPQALNEGQAGLPPPLEQFICSWNECRTSFKKVAELRHHVRSHTKGAHRCLWDGCQRPPEPTSSLNKHLDSHTKPHVCPQEGCGHRAAKLRDLRRHRLSHSIPNGAKVYYCPAKDCQYSEGRKSFSRADNAKRHIKQMHSGSITAMITRTHNT